MSAAAAGPLQRRGGGGRSLARAFDASSALVGLVALALTVAGALAPRLRAPVDPAAVSSDGGHAYTFSPGFQVHWPYAVPSHPDFTLAPGDVRVTEDGRSIGALEPAHAVIREQGGGRFNFWEGTLWFSASDGSDPRANGREYRLTVRTQLEPTAALARSWSVGLFAVLALFRILAAIGTRAARAMARAAGAVRAPVVRVVGHVPLTFRRSYCLVCAVVLGGLAVQTLLRPMPLVFEIDSFSYIQPGVLWDAGRSVAGQSTRDVGYPALAALALALGSLGRLPMLQTVLVTAGLACILAALFRVFRLAADRLAALARIPGAIAGAWAGAVATGYLSMLFSHDLFVVDLYSAMGEAPHLLPTAAALLLLVASWTAQTPPRRLAFAVGALVASYLSIMVKPHTAMTLALCAGSLAIVALRDARGFRSPAVLALCAASALVVGVVHRADAVMTPPNADFGPKTVLCNHLDVVLPVFDASTPERSRVAALMRDTLQAPSTWTLLGFEGDRCVYNAAMTEAVAAAAKAEGLTPAAWQGREFLKAVAMRPGAYARDVLRQLSYYMAHPVEDIDHHDQSVMPQDVWERFAPFMGRIRMSHDQFLADVDNWVPGAYPRLSSLGKALLRGVNATFAAVTIASTVLALAAALVLRGKSDLRLEAATLATAAFTLAFATTTALSHTFDIGRYLTDILPISLAWWAMGVTYLAHALAALSVLAARQDRHAAVMPPDGHVEPSRDGRSGAGIEGAG